MANSDSPLDGVDIVCLGSVEWLVIHSTTEYRLQGMSRTNRVLFVEPFVSFLTALRVARLQKRPMRLKSGLREAAPNLWVYSPPAIGTPGLTRWRWPALVNGWLLAWLLRGVFRRLQIKRAVMYSPVHDSVEVLKRLPAELTVYECLDHDETVAKNDRHRHLVREREEALCRKVDLVIAITEELAGPRRKLNPQTYVVNGGVDLGFFGRARAPETQIPKDIAGLKRPVIGYLGGLDPWKMNVPLIKHIAQARLDWSIALVGYIWYGFDVAQFEPCKNIHALGPKEYDDFPAYLKGMDVCVMPFPLNGITLNGDAIKAYEYLAAGKPVVSTRVPVAVRFRDVIRIAETPEEFVAAVEDALEEGPDGTAKRLRAIQGHTWDDRVRQILTLIANALAAKRTPAGSVR